MGEVGVAVLQADETGRELLTGEVAMSGVRVHLRLATSHVPSVRVVTEEDRAIARSGLTLLFKRLGFVLHKQKGFGAGATVLEHLGIVLHTEWRKVLVTEGNMWRMRSISKNLLGSSNRNARLVPFGILLSVCSVCLSLSLALPPVRYYMRSLCTDLAI